MLPLHTRLLIVFISILSFVSPFAAVVAIENAKRTEQRIRGKQDQALMRQETEAMRYQYYLDLAGRRNNLKTSMAEAKAQYEQLLKDQPDLIKQGQRTITQTTVEPVTTSKIVDTPTPSNYKPKSSATTKSS